MPRRCAWPPKTKRLTAPIWLTRPLPANSKLDPPSPEFKATAKVGAHFGSNRLKLLEEKQYNVVLKPQNDEQLLQAFMKGRADAILAGDLAVAAAMKTYNIDLTDFR